MDINKLMQEAQKMQAQMQKAQADMAKQEFVGKASNGLVEVVVSGEMKVKEVKLDPDVVDKENIEMLQDMIVIAINDAFKKVEDASAANLSDLTKGLNIPGM